MPFTLSSTVTRVCPPTRWFPLWSIPVKSLSGCLLRPILWKPYHKNLAKWMEYFTVTSIGLQILMRIKNLQAILYGSHYQVCRPTFIKSPFSYPYGPYWTFYSPGKPYSLRDSNGWCKILFEDGCSQEAYPLFLNWCPWVNNKMKARGCLWHLAYILWQV